MSRFAMSFSDFTTNGGGGNSQGKHGAVIQSQNIQEMQVEIKIRCNPCFPSKLSI